MLYNDQKMPEIQVDFSVQNEVKESESIPVERSQEGVQVSQVSSITKVDALRAKEIQNFQRVSKVEEFSQDIPDALCAAEAMAFNSSAGPQGGLRPIQWPQRPHQSVSRPSWNGFRGLVYVNRPFPTMEILLLPTSIKI